MRRIALGVGVGVAIATVQCEGTNTGNPPGPLASFDASGCRSDQGLAPAATSSAGPGPRQSSTSTGTVQEALDGDGGASRLDSNPDDFLWMNCIAWNLHGDSTLELNFWNMREGCGATWVGGSARYEGSTLKLAAFQRGCVLAGCDKTCYYDFHFELDDAPDGNIRVELDYTDEHGKLCGRDDVTTSFTLPTSTERHGTRCDPVVAGAHFPIACVRHGACGDSLVAQKRLADGGTGSSCPACPGGDVCAPFADGFGDVCSKPCGTDADCENPAMGCRNGACTIVSRWHEP